MGIERVVENKICSSCEEGIHRACADRNILKISLDPKREDGTKIKFITCCCHKEKWTESFR